MELAPVAVFVYKRPEHTRRTLASLARCPELARSPVYIFCDGPRTPADAQEVLATRAVARERAPRHAVFVEREHNLGLAASIQDGTTALCAKHGTAIIVEDDLEVAPAFLTFLNLGLERYAGDERVMQVSGYQFPVRPPLAPSALFLRFPTSWGWATWARAWSRFDPRANGATILEDAAQRRAFDLDDSYPYADMLQRQVRGEIDSWAIRWHLAVFQHQGLVLYPGQSLVRNIGFDGSGRHGHAGQGFADDLAGAASTFELPDAEIDVPSQRRVFAFLAEQAPKTRARQMRRRVAQLGSRVVGSRWFPSRARGLGTDLVERVAGTRGEQDLALYWDPATADILETWGTGTAWNEIQLFLANARGKVIDIACGTGAVMTLLGDYPALDVHGFDISDYLIGRAIERGIPRDHLRVADATKTPYADNEFDHGYSIGSLEHFTEDGIIAFVKEAHRITRRSSMHMIPVARSGRDEGWMKTHQSFHNNSVAWWLERYRSAYREVRVLESAWNDRISVGKWFLCIKEGV